MCLPMVTRVIEVKEGKRNKIQTQGLRMEVHQDSILSGDEK